MVRLLASAILWHFAAANGSNKKDLLMIAIDDMRPELGAYGCGHMITPNLDALAKESLTFDNAYVAVAWCSPSRTAFLTSRRPDTTKSWSVVPAEYWRERGGNFTTLPQYFKERGYLTVGVGKIFHPGPASGDCDSKYSWSSEALPWDGNGNKCPTGGDFFRAEVEAQTQAELKMGGGPAMMPSEKNGDSNLAPCVNATLMNIRAKRDKGSDTRPFFMNVGFHKPHIPWTVPQRYYDKYPMDKVHLPAHQSLPIDVAKIAPQCVLSGYWSDAFSDFKALRDNGTITKVNPADNTTLDEYWQRRARQAYWAALTFTDENIGQVIRAMKENGFWEDTLIVLWGDHGYQLGENDQWEKQSNFEQATRIPVMLRAPGAKGNGKHTQGLWEAVDLLPTLADLALGEVPPKCPPSLAGSRSTMLCTDGVSAAPLLEDPEQQWKSAAFSQITRGALVNGMHANLPEEVYMGYSVRTESWRYTEWVKFDNQTGIADFSKLYGQELYQEVVGEQCHFDQDHVNVVQDPSHADVVQEHSKLLRSTLPQFIV